MQLMLCCKRGEQPALTVADSDQGSLNEVSVTHHSPCERALIIAIVAMGSQAQKDEWLDL